ncbi:MAG: zinc-dependent metalloprotease [Rhodothermales bacterium]|nr:zinc-dependent metalloprotease [Rhodothermales bacterium]MBO6779005.1 zinc-dependent metalloprotease [Rhodothermales bacterium]
MRLASLLLLSLLVAAPVAAQDLPTIESKTENLDHRPGFFDLYWDDDQGKVWLEVDTLDADFLYGVALARGLGSNDVGLDRNQLGGSQVVRFERVGRKLLLVTPNLRYRAISDNALERASVDEAFAEGVVWSFPVAARTDNRFLVDATDFILHDAHGVVNRLRGSNQGTFRIDGGRSAPNPEVQKSFPDNTEMEGRITFVSDRPGGWVRSVAADPNAVTLNIRHSFIRLPDDGYQPREFDPRSGYGALSYMDYATPIGDDMTKRFIRRHRLEKKDPTAERSEPVEPIVYYLDNGTPEPVRSALLDGARWWNQAFEAAGYIDAYRVEILPDDADPLDVRYNMINWVHRSTRGWSYGSSVTDPRTGEIIKGHVLLGSLRVRQDYLLMEGLMAPYVADSIPANPDPMLDVALARIRQLSAHEVGHTLGISHNFSSSMNNRASVMDYPAPLVEIDEEGNLSFDNAYDTDIGEWDIVTILYGYSDFPEGVDEKAALDDILQSAYNRGLRYITDSDARPRGAANPASNLWDNGNNPTDALRHALEVRRKGLEQFGVSTIRQGEPLTTMHEVLVPLYLHHRFQIDAAAKMLGGAAYTYALRGDTRELPTPIPAGQQEAALAALLEALTPDDLSVPASVRNRIPPRVPGYGNNRELFDSYAAPLFDPYVPAEVVANMVIDQILAPERMTRLMYQADADADLPGLSDVLAAISNLVWDGRTSGDSYEAELQRIVRTVWTDALIEAASNQRAAPGVRSRVWSHLQDLADWLVENDGRGYEETAHRGHTLAQIERYLAREYTPTEQPARTTTPPGSPIGSGEDAIARQEARRAWLAAWSHDPEECSHDW